MNTSGNLPSDEALNAEAARWLVEQDEGLSPERAREFADWLARDSRHAEAVSRVGETLLLFNELPLVRDAFQERFDGPGDGTAVALPRSRSGWSRSLSWAAGLAAVLAVGISIGWIFSTGLAPEVAVYATSAPEPRRVALADGSVVDLNGHSQVRVLFSAKERRVDLVGGEAHFSVAHDPAKPFIVSAHGVALRAVGTAFNVRLDGEAVELVVTEGTVEVVKAPGSDAAVAPPRLIAGERAEILGNDAARPSIEKLDAEVMHELLAWQDRMTNFVDVPLRELVARINRCNSVKVVLADEVLADRKVGGVIFLNRVDRFIQLLEREGGVTAERRGSEIILRRAP